jgi:hypothetical protein
MPKEYSKEYSKKSATESSITTYLLKYSVVCACIGGLYYYACANPIDLSNLGSCCLWKHSKCENDK